MLHPRARWDHSGNLIATAPILCLFIFGATAPHWAGASSFMSFLDHTDHTQRRTTVGRTPLGEWSARRRDLYLTTHDTHSRQTSMPPGGIRTHTLSSEQPADPRIKPRCHWDRRSSYYLDEFQGFEALTGVPFVCNHWVRFSWAIKCTKRALHPSIMFISRVRLRRRSDNTTFYFQYAAFISSFTNDVHWPIPKYTNQM